MYIHARTCTYTLTHTYLYMYIHACVDKNGVKLLTATAAPVLSCLTFHPNLSIVSNKSC